MRKMFSISVGSTGTHSFINKGCPKINTRIEFATIHVVSCWQPY